MKNLEIKISLKVEYFVQRHTGAQSPWETAKCTAMHWGKTEHYNGKNENFGGVGSGGEPGMMVHEVR